jgi:DNA-directed RNA polymerase specialized sigma24 family protein
MSSAGDVTVWLDQLKAGDQAAAQPLWERYFHRLVALAEKRLRQLPRRAADEEDVALAAFHSFCRGAERGRFPRLDDRDDLWQLLVVITTRKAADLVAYENRAKRGGGKVRGESALRRPEDGPEGSRGIEQVAGAEPTPQFAAEVAEECGRLLDVLGDDRLRSIARWKLEGYTNREIAERLGRSEVIVEKKLQLIRAIWQRHGVR